MAGFLLNWQRKNGAWPNQLEDAATAREVGSVSKPWWVANQTRIAEGDRLFILAQGGVSDGLIASGYAAPIPVGKAPLQPGYVVYHDKHFREGNYITATLDVILTPDTVLSRSDLETAPNVNLLDWKHAQLPGGQIRPRGKANSDLDILPHIEDLWSTHLHKIGFPSPSMDDDERAGYVLFGEEGKPKVRTHRSRERDGALPRAKKAEATRNGTLGCEVCGFVFADWYGDHGADYIECHHREPLASLVPGTAKRTTLEDLALVCANCHRMLHRNDWPTVEMLRTRLRRRHERTAAGEC